MFKISIFAPYLFLNEMSHHEESICDTVEGKVSVNGRFQLWVCEPVGSPMMLRRAR